MAKRAINELAFPALTIEGGLFSADYFAKVAHFEADRQSDADYHVPRGLKLRDEIGRFWRVAEALWADFATRRARNDLDPRIVTVEQFLLPLMRDVLGFTDISVTGSIVIDERGFPLGYHACQGRVPLVMVGHNTLLDKADPRFGDGNRRRAPFMLAQEYLNAAPDSLWALVSNGLTLRLVRDNPSLTRPAYLEVDLERIFNESLYQDFAAFWLACHASRFGDGSAACPLETWKNSAEEAGSRAREDLRIGVKAALRELGTGFLSHPANTALLRAIQQGELSDRALFEQLLRLVYRLIFLFTVEERGILFAPEANDAAKALYQQGYSLARLRELSARRRLHDSHSDLWEALSITFTGLTRGEPALGLPALGGLFTTDQCPSLDTSRISNQHLLAALFRLGFFREGDALARINYRDMDSEELGSVYESLLELVPRIKVTNWHFVFAGDDEEASTKGNARKLTGSYYTPDSLVQELIQSALVPVIESTIKGNPDNPVAALLGLTICDPACGSGHFLLAAARKLAEHVAQLRVADGQPTRADYRHALRDVVSRCIYGVDKNPMAIELARTALWLESFEPERPLTFLDHHLRCGDALLGALNPDILKSGIPDKAFEALSGDDKAIASTLKKANAAARKSLAAIQHADLFTDVELFEEANTVETLTDDTLAAQDEKRRHWHAQLQQEKTARAAKLANLFVAAFLAPKTAESETQGIPTTVELFELASGGHIDAPLLARAQRIAEGAQAFHWWLAFPRVAKKGGFDVLLGNPPWEVSQLGEEEYFAAKAPSIAALAGAKRKHAITKLETDNPRLWVEYLNDKRTYEANNSFMRDSGRYPLTAFGKLNTYALFAETFSQLASPNGRAGFIVPTGIATDDSTKAFFNGVIKHQRLAQLVSFYEVRRWFPATDERKPFCLFTLGTSLRAKFIFDVDRISDLSQPQKWYELSQEDFESLNPNTRTLATFRSQRDAELTRRLYQVSPILIREAVEEDGNVIEPEVNPWGISFKQGLFNMTSDSGLFHDSPLSDDMPLYEAKLIHQFDHRLATFSNDGESRELTLHEKQNANCSIIPRYWVNQREVLACIARVPNTVSKAWLTGDTEALVGAVAEWVVASLFTQVAGTVPWSDGTIVAATRATETEIAKSFPLFAEHLAANGIQGKKALGVFQKTAHKHADVLLSEADLAPLTACSDEHKLYSQIECWMDVKSPRWLMGWRDITNAAAERTVIASVVPRVGVGNNMPLMFFANKTSTKQQAALLGNLCALVFDFVARHKVGGTHLNYFIYKQLPVLPPNRYIEADLDFIVPRVLELTYTAHDLKPWAEGLGYFGQPFTFDLPRRAQLRAELDAYYAKLYGITRDELRYILDPADILGEDYPSETFRVLKDNERREFGEYRTQWLVLEAWDKLAANGFTGLTYELPADERSLDYSELGFIRNETEGRFAGLVIAMLRRAGELPSTSLQSAVATAATPGFANLLLDEVDQVTFQRLLEMHPDILAAATIERLGSIIQRLESYRTLSAPRQGAHYVYKLTGQPVPEDVIQEAHLETLAELMLKIEAAREARAPKKQELADGQDNLRTA